jgi:site-specific recombinase XerD
MHTNLLDAQAKFTENLRANGKAHATVIAYSKDIEQLADFLSKRSKTLLSEVVPEDLEAFKELLKKQRYTSKSISRKINSIKAFFRFCVSEGLVEGNPTQEISQPKFDQTPPRILSRLEYRALRDSCRADARMHAIVEILLQTGMRISELAYLQLTDIDLERELIYIQAQNSREARRIPLNAAAKKSILDYLKLRPRAKEKTLFLTKTCRPFLVRNIRTAIDRYFRLAGVKDAKVNDLRHTFVVEQLKAGTPLVYVSQLVGHKRITTTEKYLHLIEAPEMQPNIKIEEL